HTQVTNLIRKPVRGSAPRIFVSGSGKDGRDMHLLEKLTTLRQHGGAIRTQGLDDTTVQRLAASHPALAAAVDAALEQFQSIARDFPEILALDEDAQCVAVQSDFVNFYPGDAVNPYVALAARGPWVVTLKGAVL